MVAGETEKEMI